MIKSMVLPTLTNRSKLLLTCVTTGVLLVLLGGVVSSATTADINKDGNVSIADLSMLLSKWGTADTSSDLDGSGRVDIVDLSILLKTYGTTTSPEPNPDPAPSEPQDTKAYGIAAGSSLLQLNQTDLNRQLDGIAASGASWVRVDFSWPSVQPFNAQDYQWDLYDRIVTAAKARNLKVLGILDYTPAWARPADCTWAIQCRPADPNQFATFAAAAAARYAPQGLHTWEIWNEPNIGFWQPRSDPAQYTALLKATSTAIRRQDSNSYILLAGLAPSYTSSTTQSPMDFLRGVYASGGQGSFDGVAMHPYTFPYKPTSSLPNPWKEMYSSNPSLHSIMAANGDGAKKIWITEFGAPTGGPGPVATLANPQYHLNPYVVDEPLQSAILADAIEQYSQAEWAGPFFYYSHVDSGTDPSSNENFYGLVRPDGSFKPAYNTFQSAARSTQR